MRGDKESGAVYQTKIPGALKVKAGEKLVSTILAASTASREPPGYYFGERVLGPECSSRWLWSDVFLTWTSAAELHGLRDAGFAL